MDLNQLTGMALAMNHELCKTPFCRSLVDVVLLSKSLGGLATEALVGYCVRVFARRTLRNRMLAVVPLSKSNPLFIEWPTKEVGDYVSWLLTSNLPREEMIQQCYFDSRKWSF